MRVFVRYGVNNKEEEEIIEVSSLPLDNEGRFSRILDQVEAHLKNKLGKKSSEISALTFVSLKD